MNILCHRGFWVHESEQNTEKSFVDCVELGFGIELDIRVRSGHLVVAHDTDVHSAPFFEDVLSALKGFSSYIAVNIKEDGLCSQASRLCNKYGIRHYLFDMSVPETVICARNSLPYFTRLSEYESATLLDNNAAGFWVDSFDDQWFDDVFLERLLSSGKEVAVVSPELHGRRYDEVWSLLRDFNKNTNLSICTDFPKHANEYFNDER